MGVEWKLTRNWAWDFLQLFGWLLLWVYASWMLHNMLHDRIIDPKTPRDWIDTYDVFSSMTFFISIALNVIAFFSIPVLAVLKIRQGAEVQVLLYLFAGILFFLPLYPLIAY